MCAVCAYRSGLRVSLISRAVRDDLVSAVLERAVFVDHQTANGQVLHQTLRRARGTWGLATQKPLPYVRSGVATLTPRRANIRESGRRQPLMRGCTQHTQHATRERERWGREGTAEVSVRLFGEAIPCASRAIAAATHNARPCDRPTEGTHERPVRRCCVQLCCASVQSPQRRSAGKRVPTPYVRRALAFASRRPDSSV